MAESETQGGRLTPEGKEALRQAHQALGEAMAESETQEEKLTPERKKKLLQAEQALNELISRSVWDLINALTAEGGVDLPAARDADDRMELCRRINRNLFRSARPLLESSEHE